MTIRFDGRVAIVTGAGGGLGRLHALALAARGAAVVVNDLGGTLDGNGGTPTAANAVADEIRAAGGKAIANGASVTDFRAVQAMVDAALAEWGRVDILVNNAGILRDKSFAKMELDDFKLVVDVHLMGAVNCTKAVWETMRAQNYGRIVMTTSSSGLFGNFGQANYGAAKASACCRPSPPPAPVTIATRPSNRIVMLCVPSSSVCLFCGLPEFSGATFRARRAGRSRSCAPPSCRRAPAATRRPSGRAPSPWRPP